MFKRMIPTILIVAAVNAIGYLFASNYMASVFGSLVGAMIGFIVSEVRFRNPE